MPRARKCIKLRFGDKFTIAGYEVEVTKRRDGGVNLLVPAECSYLPPVTEVIDGREDQTEASVIRGTMNCRAVSVRSEA